MRFFGNAKERKPEGQARVCGPCCNWNFKVFFISFCCLIKLGGGSPKNFFPCQQRGLSSRPRTQKFWRRSQISPAFRSVLIKCNFLGVPQEVHKPYFEARVFRFKNLNGPNSLPVVRDSSWDPATSEEGTDRTSGTQEDEEAACPFSQGQEVSDPFLHIFRKFTNSSSQSRSSWAHSGTSAVKTSSHPAKRSCRSSHSSREVFEHRPKTWKR